jgi:hypothetical protein
MNNFTINSYLPLLIFCITLPISLILYIYWNLLGVGSNYLHIFSNTFNVVKTIGSEKVHFGASKLLNIFVD